MKAVLQAFLLLVGVVIAGGGVAAYAVATRGLSARVPPGAVEMSIAMAMRRLATPSADSWGLVHFIRKLPSLPADDVARMETMKRFLSGVESCSHVMGIRVPLPDCQGGRS